MKKIEFKIGGHAKVVKGTKTNSMYRNGQILEIIDLDLDEPKVILFKDGAYWESLDNFKPVIVTE